MPLHNPEPASVVDGRPLLYDASLHLDARRLGVRELPHLRRLRQPRVGPRQPGRRRAQQPQPVHASGRRSPRQSSRPSPDEGPDDDAEPARHGEPRPDALARRPLSRRQRRPDATRHRRVRRGRRVQEVQRRVRGPARAQRAAHRRDMQAVHGLHPAGDLPAEPDPEPRQLARPRRRTPGATFYFGADLRRRSSTATAATCSIRTATRVRRRLRTASSAPTALRASRTRRSI